MSDATLMPPRTDVLPTMMRCTQRLPHHGLDDAQVADATRAAFAAAGLDRAIKPGQTIALTCGSRGIDRIALVTRTVVEQVKAIGATPFVFPAMGSHGGATAQGQTRMLASVGVTEASVGCEIRSSMDVITLGKTDAGLTVYLDKHASQADGIICLNRIKPHTNFHGRVESGLCKMLAIGAGKHAQAIEIHRYGVAGLRDAMPQVARVILEQANVLGGIGLVEDAHHKLCRVAGVPNGSADAWIDAEAALLDEARRHMPGLPVAELDLLIADQIGKNISGTGMDPNVIGRCRLLDFVAFPEPRIMAIAVLGLTPQTHGNCIGIGMADITTRRVADAFDAQATYRNVVTGFSPAMGAMPVTVADDHEAVRTALDYMVGPVDPADARVIRIKNTLELETMLVSRAVAQQIAGRDGLTLDDAPDAWAFDDGGNLGGF